MRKHFASLFLAHPVNGVYTKSVAHSIKQKNRIENNTYTDIMIINASHTADAYAMPYGNYFEMEESEEKKSREIT